MQYTRTVFSIDMIGTFHSMFLAEVPFETEAPSAEAKRTYTEISFTTLHCCRRKRVKGGKKREMKECKTTGTCKRMLKSAMVITTRKRKCFCKTSSWKNSVISITCEHAHGSRNARGKQKHTGAGNHIHK